MYDRKQSTNHEANSFRNVSVRIALLTIFLIGSISTIPSGAYGWETIAEGANMLNYYTSFNEILCTTQGILLRENNRWNLYGYGNLPVWDITYIGNNTYLAILGDGSRSDGIYHFTTGNHQFQVNEWFFRPHFLFETHDYIYVGGQDGLTRSANGIDWTPYEMFNEINCQAMASYQGHLVVSADQSVIYHSADNGLTWTPSQPGAPWITDMVFDENGVLYGIFPNTSFSSGLWSSTDFGMTWNVEFWSIMMSSVYRVGEFLFVAWEEGQLDQQGIAIWNPETQQLQFMNDGLPNLQINRLSENTLINCLNIVCCTTAGAYMTCDFAEIPQVFSFQGRYFELISFYYNLYELNAENLFGGVENLAIVYQDDGGIFIPPHLNTIGNVDVTRGYRVYCTQNSELRAFGTMLNPDTEYEINAGPWNWLGYPFDYPVPVTVALASIEQQLEIVMTDNGRIWIPPLNIDTMGDMLPGEGFMMISNEDVTFQYDTDLALAAGSMNAPRYSFAATEYPQPTGLPYPVIIQLSDALKDCHPSIISLYDGSLLVGQAVIPDDQERFPVIAWGGNEERGLEGFQTGHTIEVRIFNAMDNEIPVKVAGLVIHPENSSFSNCDVENLTFGVGAYTEVILDIEYRSLPKTFEVGAGFPNPFNPTITIPFVLPETGQVTFALHTILGQQVFRAEKYFQAGANNFTLDLGGNSPGFASGIYLLTVSYGDRYYNQKILFLK